MPFFPLRHPSLSFTGNAPTYYLFTPLLSPNRFCTHYDVTIALFCRRLIKKKKSLTTLSVCNFFLQIFYVGLSWNFWFFLNFFTWSFISKKELHICLPELFLTFCQKKYFQWVIFKVFYSALFSLNQLRELFILGKAMVYRMCSCQPAVKERQKIALF